LKPWFSAVPVLKKHLEYLLDRHANYAGVQAKPDDLGEIFSTAWTRSAIADIVDKGIGHLTQVGWSIGK
jgi:hypothetical protein